MDNLDFAKSCKAMGGVVLAGRCEKSVSFTNMKRQVVSRLVQISPVTGGYVITEGSPLDSGFDQNIFVPKHNSPFGLAKQIISAEGHPEKMMAVLENISDYDAEILESDSKIFDELA